MIHPEDRLPCGRQTPAGGVLETPDGRTILVCTVCTKDRREFPCRAALAETLITTWHEKARSWIVGRWLLMPDHVHFFCTPSVECRHSIERWAEFWKDQLSKQLGLGAGFWQRGLFHHRIRSAENYMEKLTYLSQNPVRAGLVTLPEDWPWQGEMERITWD